MKFQGEINDALGMGSPDTATKIHSHTVLLAQTPNGHDFYQKLDVLKRTGQFAAAIEWIIRHKPFHSEERWILLTQTYLFFDKTGSASETIERALSQNPTQPRSLLLHAIILTKQGKFLEALRSIKKAERYVSGTHITLRRDILIHMAWLYTKLGRYTLAIEKSSAALELDPDSNRSRFVLGSSYFLRMSETVTVNEDLAMADHQFSKIDPRELVREESGNAYSFWQILYNADQIKTQLVDSMDRWSQIRSIIRGYPIDRVPALANAYWQCFVQYRPDPPPAPGENYDFKSPADTLRDGYGDCDDALIFFDALFSDRKISHLNIMYEVAPGISHVGSLFNTGNGWKLISSSGIEPHSGSTPRECLEANGIRPSTTQRIKIQNSQVIKTGGV